MRELSPYRAIRPPHLDGAFRARRGEFRLVALPDGRTRLEGSTWYTLELAPGGYWRLWADLLVHAIHARVLAHAQQLAEAAGREAGMLAGAGERAHGAVGQRVHPHVLQDLERHALGEALGQPLVRAAVATRQVELHDVGELVGDEPLPLEPAARGLGVQQHAAGPGQARRERRDLVHAVDGHVALVHQPLAERRARR